MEMGHLLEFFGTECGHCKQLDSLLDRLEEELGVTVTRLEVWHNQANAELLKQYDQGFCGGVPFLFNTRSKRWLCGEASYESLKSWAQS